MSKPDFEISGFSTEIYVMSGGARLTISTCSKNFIILYFCYGAIPKFQNFMVLVRCGPKISKLFKNLKNLESTASGTWIPSQNQVNIQAKYAILNLVLTWS